MENLPRPFVDTHVHFWRRDRLDYAWLEDFPELPGSAEPAHLREQSAGAFPDAIVFVEADCAATQSLAEAEWVAELSKSEAALAGIVAAAPLERGSAAAPVLDALQRLPGLKGVRRLVQGQAPGFALKEGFVAAVRGLAERGLSFDLCIQPMQIEEAADLVAACPEVSFVLDHCGKPPIAAGDAAGDLAAWRDGLSRLAANGNVVCKLSGLVTEADPRRVSAEALRPTLECVLAEFGAERLMFGSDWPVVRLASTYCGWLELALELTAHLPEAARSAIFADNARRVYRLAV